MIHLRYIVNGIGIYVAESDDAVWNTLVVNWLQKELDSSLSEMDEKEVKQKLIIRPYSLLGSDLICHGFVIPHHSVYDNGLFVSFRLKIALRLEKDYLIYWIGREYLADILCASFTFPFFLQLLFAQRNMAFIHSVGIVVNGKGVLLPAFPGMHKTSFVSRVVSTKGVKMMGDEFSLLDKDGYLYPYPQHFFLTAEHRPFFPEYFENNDITFPTELNLRRRISRRLRYILNTMSEEEKQYYILVPPSLLFDKARIANERVPVDRVYALRSWRGIGEIRCRETEDTTRLANFCVSSTAYEMDVMQRLNFNLLAQKGESISGYYGRLEDVVQRGLDKSSKKYLVDIPEEWDARQVVKELCNLVIGKNCAG